MSNVLAPNRSYLCAERASHLTVKVDWLPVDVCGGGSLFDELGCFLRVRHVSDMAGIHFDRLGVGELRHHPLLLGIDRPVGAGHYVKGWLVLPSGIRDLMGERVGGNRHLRDSHEVSLGRGNIRCEVGNEMLLLYPPVPIAIRLE